MCVAAGQPVASRIQEIGHWLELMSDPAADEPELVPGPVAPVDEFEVPPGDTRDTILSDLGLSEIYDNRCGSMIKVPVDARHVDLYTEFTTSKSKEEVYADCFSADNKKYRSHLPNRALLGKTEIHVYKDHLVSKAITQASLSKCYDLAHLEKHGVTIINVATIIEDPIRFAYHGRSDSLIIVTSTDIDRLPGQGDRRRMLLNIVKRVGTAGAEWLRKPGADTLHELGLVDYETVRVRNPAPKQKGERDGTRAPTEKKGEWDWTHAQKGKFVKGPEFGKQYGKGKFDCKYGKPKGKFDDWFDPYYGKPKGKLGKFDDWFDPWSKGKFGKPFDEWTPVGKGFDDWTPVGKGFDDFGLGKSKDSPGEWSFIHAGKGPPTAPTAVSRDSSVSEESSAGHTQQPPKIFTLGAEYIHSESIATRLKGDSRIVEGCFVSCLPLRDKDPQNRPTKHETGMAVSLQEKLQRQTGFAELLDKSKKTLEKYGVLALYCRHGFHRSVGIAQILKKELPNVDCVHMTLHKHKDRYAQTPGLWSRKKMSYEQMDTAIAELAKQWPAGPNRAELQEQLQLKETQARCRALERKLQESKGNQNPGSESQSKGVASPASKDPPKGSSNPGGTVLPPKDPKRVADRLLSDTLKPSKYQYMRTEGLCQYDTERKMHMCALCDVYSEELGKPVYINPITPAHLDSHQHLMNVAWHCHMKGDGQTRDWYYELAHRVQLTSEWETVKYRKKGEK